MTIKPDGLARGPAKYFHGRRRILAAFQDRCARALNAKRGTTFMIQGAPGAGKTALTYQGMALAEAHGWIAARIRPPHLCDAVELAQILQDDTGIKGKLRYWEKIASEIEAIGPVTRRDDLQSLALSRSTSAALDLIRRVGRERGLLLVVDEAQHLFAYRDADYYPELVGQLNAIHNGEIGAPVMLLAAGLSTLEAAFGEYGVSRFDEDCRIYLQRLNPDSARAVIRDYLTISGGVRGQQVELHDWVYKLEQHTQRWPAHIAAWGEKAAAILQANGSRLTAEAWETLERRGRQRDNVYYASRLVGVAQADIDVLGRLLSRKERGAILYEREVFAALAEDRTEAEIRHVFQRVLEKGILAYNLDRNLVVPIPSMHYWLLNRYQEMRKSIAPTVGMDVEQ